MDNLEMAKAYIEEAWRRIRTAGRAASGACPFVTPQAGSALAETSSPLIHSP